MTLTAEERAKSEAMVSKGKAGARMLMHARIFPGRRGRRTASTSDRTPGSRRCFSALASPRTSWTHDRAFLGRLAIRDGLMTRRAQETSVDRLVFGGREAA